MGTSRNNCTSLTNTRPNWLLMVQWMWSFTLMNTLKLDQHLRSMLQLLEGWAINSVWLYSETNAYVEYRDAGIFLNQVIHWPNLRRPDPKSNSEIPWLWIWAWSEHRACSDRWTHRTFLAATERFWYAMLLIMILLSRQHRNSVHLSRETCIINSGLISLMNYQADHVWSAT